MNEAGQQNARLAELLQRAYAAELETLNNYLTNSVWLDGLRAEEIKEALEEDLATELGHAKKLAQRMKQLNICPKGSMSVKPTQQTLQPPSDSTDIIKVVRGVLDAERDAIGMYQDIIRECEQKDYVTQELAIDILTEEEEHRTLFEGFERSLAKHGAKS